MADLSLVQGNHHRQEADTVLLGFTPRAMSSSNLPKSSDEPSAVQILDCSRARLKASAQTEQRTTRGNGQSSADIITSRACEACSEECSSGEHGHHESTAKY